MLFLMTNLWIHTSNLNFFSDFREEKNDYAYIGKSRDELKVITKDLISYIQFGGEEKLTTHFNEREVFHMRDVRTLFVISLILMGVSLFLCVLFWVLSRRSGETQGLLRVAFYSIILILGLCVVFGIGMVFNFDTAFVRFHEIFFDNDLWLLDPRTDLMIRMLPQELFTRIFIRILAGFAAFSAIALWILKKLGKERTIHGNQSNDRSYPAESGRDGSTDRRLM